jgi:hypothetical protein
MNSKAPFTVQLDETMVKHLINAGFYPKVSNLFRQALDLNNTEIIRYILNRKLINIKRSKYLFYAIIHSNITTIQLLLDYGADPKSIDYERLYASAIYNRIQLDNVITLFLTNGLDLSKILSHVLHFKDTRTIRRLIPYLSEDQSELDHILNHLIVYGTISDVKDLLKRVSLILLTGQNRKHSDTALHYAVRRNELQYVKLLLSYGADLYLKNGEGLTVHELAEQLKNHKMVKLLQWYDESLYIKGAIDD